MVDNKKYKLYYFNKPGRAEPIRFLFKYAGINFEDIRLDRNGTDWINFKNQTPFRQLPMLEYEGKFLVQSVAIARYVAKKANLTGQNEWEDLEIDSVVDTIVDLRAKALPGLREQEAGMRSRILQAFIYEDTPSYLKRFEVMAKKNNGFLAAGKLSWADFYLIALFLETYNEAVRDQLICPHDPFVLNNCPTLEALEKKIYENSAIKEWMKACSKTMEPHFAPVL